MEKALKNVQFTDVKYSSAFTCVVHYDVTSE